MKTAEEILIKVLNECENPNDLDLVNILAKRNLPYMKKAMEAYAMEVLNSIPEGTYKHDSLLTNPNTQETFTLKEFIEKL